MADKKTELLGLGNVEMRTQFVTDLVAHLRDKYGDDVCGSSVMPELLLLTSLVLSGKYATESYFCNNR
ncbi:TPA: hypothetical protein OT801_000596 [Morganella morganii]|nr:hypothetical protein [Morganella morganii]HCT7721709.1 hypothetical protein [Morganella morganii]